MRDRSTSLSDDPTTWSQDAAASTPLGDENCSGGRKKGDGGWDRRAEGQQ